MNTERLPPLVVIAGPTASGKSALAMALSRLTPSVIVNADASQVYRDLRIVTARPTPEDEAQAPHALYGHVDGARSYSAAAWANDAKAAISNARVAGRLPILVGGTGLYIRTLLDGIAPVPEIDPEIRQAVRAMPVADAYQALSEEDGEAAARLSRGDKARVARALEVVRATGRPLAQWQQKRGGGIGDAVRVAPAVLLPPRPWLNAQCDARFAAIAAEGRGEVRALMARGLNPALPVMRAIGVREIAALIAEPGREAKLVAAGQLATRRYAKRQYTWLRHQPPTAWPRIGEQLDCDRVNKFAIKLRDTALTE